jgi:dihydroorotate dehydrogenase electron transfer subunit
VAAADEGAGTVDVLYEEVGPKTGALRRLAAGAEVGFVGPLGNAFEPPPEEATPVLAGGGIGVPPLIHFGASLVRAGRRPLLLIGARSAGKHLGASLLAGAGTVRRATDDGTLGHCGLLTDLLEEALEEAAHPVVYTCGPHPMMAAVAALCARREVVCQASLEAYMACGFGVCVGCVVELTDGEARHGAYGRYARVCVDGPVFDARRIVW